MRPLRSLARKTRRASGRVVVVVLPTEIDIDNSEQVGILLGATLAAGADVLVADLTATTFCDVSGMRAMIRATDEAAAIGGQLRLALPVGRIRQLLNLTSLDSALLIYPSVRQAVAA
jgi:anti-anti-sigma factor